MTAEKLLTLIDRDDTAVVTAWGRTPRTHEGWPVYQNGFNGELAFEVIQEGRLVALPSEVEAAIRRTFGEETRP